MTPPTSPANDNHPPIVAGRIVDGELVELDDDTEAADGRP